MNIRAVIFTCMVLFPSSLFAREKTDVIVMKNGDRITCEIKGLSAGVLSIKLSYVEGIVGLEWAQVARLESNQLFLVQTEDGTVYTGKLSAVAASGEHPMSIQVALDA